MEMISYFGGGDMIKRFIKGAGFFALLCGLFWVATPVTAQDPTWSPVQKEVLKFLDNYAELQLKGTLDEFMATFHPGFQNWNYGNPLPRPLKWQRDEFAFSRKHFAQIVMDLQPVTIEVDDDLAVVNLWYRERYRAKDASGNPIVGKDQTVAGPRSITLIKVDGKWYHLNWAWQAKAGFFTTD